MKKTIFLSLFIFSNLVYADRVLLATESIQLPNGEVFHARAIYHRLASLKKALLVSLCMLGAFKLVVISGNPRQRPKLISLNKAELVDNYRYRILTISEINSFLYL